mmetsp:Transcript_118041/g.185480  ORF Transcript_118041/g.185480 Transcript_118041/m.185480 type:complete len:226 (+) Transcript_118041:136-813(+)
MLHGSNGFLTQEYVVMVEVWLQKAMNLPILGRLLQLVNYARQDASLQPFLFFRLEFARFATKGHFQWHMQLPSVHFARKECTRLFRCRPSVLDAMRDRINRRLELQHVYLVMPPLSQGSKAHTQVKTVSALPILLFMQIQALVKDAQRKAYFALEVSSWVRLEMIQQHYCDLATWLYHLILSVYTFALTQTTSASAFDLHSLRLREIEVIARRLASKYLQCVATA